MPRPSRNVDQLLLKAGHELLPATGVRALSIRQVTERAGVNLGMFHYHFKTKDVFVRAILESQYNQMFASLEIATHRSTSVVENLRAAVMVLALFGRDNRMLLVRLAGDALAGEVMAVEFLRANLPRHIAVIAALIAQGQKLGRFRKMPIPQAIAFLMGGVGAPILLGAALVNSGFAPPPLASGLDDAVFSDAAIRERIEMALTGLAAKKSGAGK